MSTPIQTYQQGTQSPAEFANSKRKNNNMIGWILGALAIALMGLAVFLKG